MITRLPPKETIWRVIKDIEKGYFKLPNIQRYFVWDEDKILQLLDSIFKGYPFGSMLLWKPNEELKIKARDFIKDFKEGMRLLSHIQDNNDFYLVLDGQQRLQSLYILLMGLYNDQKVYFKLDAKDDESKYPPSKLGGIAGKGWDEATPPCDSSPQQAVGYSRWNFINFTL